MIGDTGLFHDYPRNQIKDQILISYSIPDARTKTVVRYFTILNGIDDLEHLLEQIPKVKQHLFEVILGENPQKPHFDIDCKSTPEVGRKIYFKLIQVLMSLGIEQNEIRLYDSSSSIKQSYHIVIPTRHCENAQEAKLLWKYCVSQMGELGIYVDHAVYSSLQNFRLKGSCKPVVLVSKELSVNWPFNEGSTLLDSLVSVLNPGSRPLPRLPIQESKPREILTDDVELTQEHIETTMRLFISAAESKNEEPHAELKRVDGPLLIMKRISSSPCWCSCQPRESETVRIHEAENPFILVHVDHTSGHAYAYYFCRRDDTKKQLGRFVFNNPKTFVQETKVVKITEEDKKIQKVKALLTPGQTSDQNQMKRLVKKY